MKLTTIKRLGKLEGKRVMVRVDFNVPVKKGKVLDDRRIRAALPTLKYLIKEKARVIVVTHLGRPNGRALNSLQLDPVAKRLSTLLGKKVNKLPDWRGTLVDMAMRRQRPGQVLMLENIRFSSNEKDNTGSLAEELASLCDIFVFDGFGVAHRSDASVVGIPKHVRSYAGLLLEEEIKCLDKAMKKPKKPFVLALGGAKVETKLPVIKHLLPKVSHVLMGGLLFNTYLKAMDYQIGASLYEEDEQLLKSAYYYGRRKKVIKPVDVIVGDPEGKEYRVVQVDSSPHKICKKAEAILDVGPETIRLFSEYIKSAKTIVWNGTMGYFEQAPYDKGTHALARLIASRSKGRAYGILGGGETLQAIKQVGMQEDMDYISTGGGAMLSYLAGEKLPGLEALRKSK